MKKTAKQKVDRFLGAVILLVVVIFVGRYYLSNVDEYKEIEGNILRKLKVPELTEKVVEVLDLGDDEDEEKFQRAREDRLETEKRPDFGIKIPLGEKVESKYEVVPLMDKEYFPALRKAIKKAKKSIYVAMYVMSLGDSMSDPVNVLLNELIAAKKRGVEVKVIVENPIWSGSSLYKKNEEAIEYLKRGGVEAAFDSPKTEVHDKFILIDEDTLFVGNHNWSKQSLTINRELSVMVKADPADPDFLKHFACIKLARPGETREGKIKLIKEIYKELLSRKKNG